MDERIKALNKAVGQAFHLWIHEQPASYAIDAVRVAQREGYLLRYEVDGEKYILRWRDTTGIEEVPKNEAAEHICLRILGLSGNEFDPTKIVAVTVEESEPDDGDDGADFVIAEESDEEDLTPEELKAGIIEEWMNNPEFEISLAAAELYYDLWYNLDNLDEDLPALVDIKGTGKDGKIIVTDIKNLN